MSTNRYTFAVTYFLRVNVGRQTVLKIQCIVRRHVFVCIILSDVLRNVSCRSSLNPRVMFGGWEYMSACMTDSPRGALCSDTRVASQTTRQHIRSEPSGPSRRRRNSRQLPHVTLRSPSAALLLTGQL